MDNRLIATLFTIEALRARGHVEPYFVGCRGILSESSPKIWVLTLALDHSIGVKAFSFAPGPPAMWAPLPPPPRAGMGYSFDHFLLEFLEPRTEEDSIYQTLEAVWSL